MAYDQPFLDTLGSERSLSFTNQIYKAVKEYFAHLSLSCTKYLPKYLVRPKVPYGKLLTPVELLGHKEKFLYVTVTGNKYIKRTEQEIIKQRPEILEWQVMD